MPIIEPSTGRATVIDNMTSLEIDIPSTRNYLLLAFLGFWLYNWADGEYFAFKQIFFDDPASGQHPASVIFLAAWLIGWTIGGSIALYFILYNLLGKQVVKVSNESLSIAQNLFGISIRKKTYQVHKIKNLQAASLLPDKYSRHISGLIGAFTSLLGPINFKYNGKPVGFAGGIDVPEAKILLSKIQRYIPDDVNKGFTNIHESDEPNIEAMVADQLKDV